MPRVVVGNMRDGRRITDIPYLSYSWELLRNQPGSLTCTLPIYDPDVAALDLRSAATPGKAYLAVIEDNDFIPNAGLLAKPVYDWDAMRLEFSAPGIWAMFGKVPVLPPAAATADVSSFLIPDPSDTTKTMPNPALGTTLSGMDHGSIAFGLLRQALAWPGGQLPLVIPPDRPGTRTRTYDAVAFKPIAEALLDLTNLENGPDIAFRPRLQADRGGIEWEVAAGTDADPALRSTTVHRVDLSTQQPSARRLSTDFDTKRMGSIGWATGGRSDDRVLVARSVDTFLIDAGYPLQHLVDSSHSDVSEQPRLDSYAAALTRGGRTPAEFWSYEIQKAVWLRSGMTIGDRNLMIVRGDPYIPDGKHLREIAGMAGDDGDWVTITTAEV